MKVDAFRRCKWYLGRGMPVVYVAQQLGVSPVTVRAWRRLVSTDHTFEQLRRRVISLPDWRREQLITDLVTRRLSSAR